MTEEKKTSSLTPDDMKVASGFMMLLACICLPIAAGILLGAGWGWLVFVLLLVAGAFRFGNLAKKEEAEAKAKVEGTPE